jgi:hypothetical protein
VAGMSPTTARRSCVGLLAVLVLPLAWSTAHAQHSWIDDRGNFLRIEASDHLEAVVNYDCRQWLELPDSTLLASDARHSAAIEAPGVDPHAIVCGRVILAQRGVLGVAGGYAMAVGTPWLNGAAAAAGLWLSHRSRAYTAIGRDSARLSRGQSGAAAVEGVRCSGPRP